MKFTDPYRVAAQTNIDNLGSTRMLLEEQIRDVEKEAADSLAKALRKVRDDHASALSAALRPLEEELNDINVAIYSQERAIGALPAPAASFSERREDPPAGTAETEEPIRKSA